MVVRRRTRVVAAGGGLALAGAVGVGAVVAPRASSAPRPAALSPTGPFRTATPPSGPASAAASPSSGSTVGPVAAGAAAPGSATVGSAAAGAAASPVLASVAATGHVGTRLTLAVRPGRTLTVSGSLTRASGGAAVRDRAVLVYAREADTGRWRLVAAVRTSSRGRVTYRLRSRPQVQLTLRFVGDRRFRPAASVTIVPAPSATRMQKDLVRALARARAAAARAGLTLVVNSGWRSWAKQERMYEAAVRRYGSARVARRWVLPPQESTHVRGLAADVGTPATAAWLARHGAAFGLCRTYGDEPWHVEYRPDWIRAFGGRCPAPVPLPGDPDPLSPAPHVAVVF